MSPLAQARFCAIQDVNAQERDPQLVHSDGRHQGKLAFPLGHGVVFTRITRRQFDAAGLGEAIEPNYVICQDEMLETVDPEAFQQRLWDMFPHTFGGGMMSGGVWPDLASAQHAGERQDGRNGAARDLRR